MDWTGWIDPAEKPSPLRAPVVLKSVTNFFITGCPPPPVYDNYKITDVLFLDGRRIKLSLSKQMMKSNQG